MLVEAASVAQQTGTGCCCKMPEQAGGRDEGDSSGELRLFRKAVRHLSGEKGLKQ